MKLFELPQWSDGNQKTHSDRAATVKSSMVSALNIKAHMVVEA